jgi:hypothetical protein
MMKVPDSHLKDRTGVSAISKKFTEDLGWIFREQSSDFGVDAQVEIVDGKHATGKLLGLQIKSGESFFSERTEKSITYRGDREHLDYWLNHRLPILIVLYEPTSGTAYWEQVKEDRVVKTEKAWKIEVPVSQRVDQPLKSQLELIADGPPYFIRLRQLQFAAPWMQHLADGDRLIVTAEEWVNKSSGKGRVTLLLEDDHGSETVLQDWQWAIFFPGYSYDQALAEFLPWATLSIDEEFYDDYDYDRYEEECGHYDSETGSVYCHETFTEWKSGHDRSYLRPYQDNGETASWRLKLELNDLGNAFLRTHNYLSESD